MAHILVYLQRTPLGLHPASAVALCLARDIGSDRGASITAVCAGDAGDLDRGTMAAAGRFGADVLIFCGPGGLEKLQERLRPVHVLAPWTAEGQAAVQGLPGGPVVPRLLDSRRPSWGSADSVTGLVAGVLPWHELPITLEGEYDEDLDQVPMPAWVEQVGSEKPETFAIAGRGPLAYVAPQGLDRNLRDRLEGLGAAPASAAEAAGARSGTVLWLDPGGPELPDALAGRAPAARLVLMPGPDASLHPSWALADWVLPGLWPDLLETLKKPPWRTALKA